jgi:hypothetical protein
MGINAIARRQSGLSTMYPNSKLAVLLIILDIISQILLFEIAFLSIYGIFLTSVYVITKAVSLGKYLAPNPVYALAMSLASSSAILFSAFHSQIFHGTMSIPLVAAAGHNSIFSAFYYLPVCLWVIFAMVARNNRIRVSAIMISLLGTALLAVRNTFFIDNFNSITFLLSILLYVDIVFQPSRTNKSGR